MSEIYFDNSNVCYQGIYYKVKSVDIDTINKKQHYKIITEENNIFIFVNGLLHHEEDLPSIIWDDGSQFWYKNGKLHRGFELAAIIWSFNKEEYYNYGKLLNNENIPKLIAKKNIENF
jgi:fructose-1,6-bisphosphatase